MDASAGATTNGNGHAVPDPVSLPSAVAAPEGAPVSSATSAPAAGAPAVERDEKGRVKKGKSLNPKGRPAGAPSLNNQLISAIKHFKIGAKSYLELFLTRSLQDVEYAKLIAPKVFGNVDLPAAAGISIHNNPTATATHQESHVDVAKLIADPRGRDGVAEFAERLAACRALPGEPRDVRQ